MDENKEIKYSNKNFEDIEEARKVFKSFYTKTAVIKGIGSVLAIAIMVAGFIVTRFYKENTFTILIFSALVGIGVLALFSLLTNRARKKKISILMDVYYQSFSKYLFEEDFEITSNQEDRIPIEDFDKNGLYKDIANCPSRNVTYVKSEDLSFKTYEISGQAVIGRKTYPVFVGKIFEFKNDYDDEPIIYYFKAKNKDLELPPTNLDNIKEVENTDEYVIYSNNKEYKKVFKKSVIDALKKIVPDEVVIDGSISIQKGMTYFAIGLDDTIMAVPFKEQFNELPMKVFKKDLEYILNAIRLFNKNGKKVD